MVVGDLFHIDGLPTFHAPSCIKGDSIHILLPCNKWQLMITRIMLEKNNMYHCFQIMMD
jgi:hypothetical protein